MVGKFLKNTHVLFYLPIISYDIILWLMLKIFDFLNILQKYIPFNWCMIDFV